MSQASTLVGEIRVLGLEHSAAASAAKAIQTKDLSGNTRSTESVHRTFIVPHLSPLLHSRAKRSLYLIANAIYVYSPPIIESLQPRLQWWYRTKMADVGGYKGPSSCAKWYAERRERVLGLQNVGLGHPLAGLKVGSSLVVWSFFKGACSCGSSCSQSNQQPTWILLDATKSPKISSCATTHRYLAMGSVVRCHAVRSDDLSP